MDEARLDAVGDPALRELLRRLRGGPGPATVDAIAAAFGIHPNVARQRLERLARAGFLTVSVERRRGGPGAGRPAKLYSVAPELAAVEFPPRRYEALVGLLLEGGGDGEARGRIGAAFGRTLARESGLRQASGLRRGLERACSALGSLGYHTSLEQVDAGEAVLRTPTCPLRPVVIAHPAAAGLDRGLWAGLVEAAVRGVDSADVECETEGCHGRESACTVRLRLRGDSKNIAAV